MQWPKKIGFWQISSVMLAFVLSLLAFTHGLSSSSLDQKINLAKKLTQFKKYEQAIQIYIQMSGQQKDDARHPLWLLEVARIYAQEMKKADKAIQVYQYITLNYPSTPFAKEAYLNRANLYFDLAQYEAALKDYQNILSNFPDSSNPEEFFLKMGICQLKLKNYDAARREWKKVLERKLESPLTDQVLYYLANSYFLDAQPKEAISIYETLIDRYPKSSFILDAQFNLAESYEELHQYDQALLIYNHLKSTFPNPKIINRQIEKNREKKTEFEKNPKAVKLELAQAKTLSNQASHQAPQPKLNIQKSKSISQYKNSKLSPQTKKLIQDILKENNVE